MIEAIACVGRSGQLGLNRQLPWGKDAAPGDLKWFKEMTMAADVCIVGHNTAKGLPPLGGRALISDDSRATVEKMLECIEGYKFDRIMIIGGAKTYARWMPYIMRWHIGRANYDGPADVWMPPLW